jgi:hypothetical protein
MLYTKYNYNGHIGTNQVLLKKIVYNNIIAHLFAMILQNNMSCFQACKHKWPLLHKWHGIPTLDICNVLKLHKLKNEMRL